MKYKYSQGVQIIFSPCDTHISLKGASGNLEFRTTFAEPIKIYLSRKFHKILIEPFARNSRKVGIPLKNLTAKINKFLLFFVIVIFMKN
jgi:hypothetical protein